MGRGRGLARAAGRAASPPRTAARRRPAPEEIAAYHRDANTYFALRVLYGVAMRIDTAPPPAALALQRFPCIILEGYGVSHSVRTRYENAMPRLFHCTQVEGMPPHSSDMGGPCATARSGAWTRTSSSRNFAAWRPRREGWRSAPMPGTAACRRGRAVTYAVADPERSIFDEPAAGGRRGCPGRAAAGARPRPARRAPPP